MNLLPRTAVAQRLLIAWALTLAASPAMALDVGDHCDLTGPDIRALPTADATVCAATCEAEAACRGFSFITGWNRCFLKSKVKGRHTVRMYGGELADKERRVERAAYDTDYSGKDFRKVAPENDKDACAKACVDDARCKAFVLIEGYRVCWLKESVGRARPKMFQCGVKP